MEKRQALEKALCKAIGRDFAAGSGAAAAGAALHEQAAR